MVNADDVEFPLKIVAAPVVPSILNRPLALRGVQCALKRAHGRPVPTVQAE